LVSFRSCRRQSTLSPEERRRRAAHMRSVVLTGAKESDRR
jgi:hypothetical protein